MISYIDTLIRREITMLFTHGTHRLTHISLNTSWAPPHHSHDTYCLMPWEVSRRLLLTDTPNQPLSTVCPPCMPHKLRCVVGVWGAEWVCGGEREVCVGEGSVQRKNVLRKGVWVVKYFWPEVGDFSRLPIFKCFNSPINGKVTPLWSHNQSDLLLPIIQHLLHNWQGLYFFHPSQSYPVWILCIRIPFAKMDCK